MNKHGSRRAAVVLNDCVPPDNLHRRALVAIDELVAETPSRAVRHAAHCSTRNRFGLDNDRPPGTRRLNCVAGAAAAAVSLAAAAAACRYRSSRRRFYGSERQLHAPQAPVGGAVPVEDARPHASRLVPQVAPAVRTLPPGQVVLIRPTPRPHRGRGQAHAALQRRRRPTRSNSVRLAARSLARSFACSSFVCHFSLPTPPALPALPA